MKFKRSSLVVKLIALIIVAYGMVTLVTLQSQVNTKKAEAEQLAEQVQAQEAKNDALQDAIDNLNTDDGVKDVARSQLGLVGEGEVVFHDIGD